MSMQAAQITNGMISLSIHMSNVHIFNKLLVNSTASALVFTHNTPVQLRTGGDWWRGRHE